MASFTHEIQLIDGVSNLRNQFRQTFDCLSHLQCRLETQIDSTTSSSINPITLSQKIERLQKSLASIEKKANMVANKKRILVPQLVHAMSSICSSVHELRCQSGLKSSGIPENVLSDLYDETLKYKDLQTANDADNNGDDAAGDGHCNGYYDEDNEDDSHDSLTMNQSHDYSNNNSSDDIEYRFNNLPSSTKQRVAFEQMNEALDLIKKLYLGPPKKQRKAIPVKTLASNGARITGQTGTAIVNCLRSLKLIKVTKQGISLQD